MSRLIVFLLAVVIAVPVFAQDQQPITLKGKVIEEETKSPVPFASVFLKRSTIGTITNDEGKFEFNIDPERFRDTLMVACLGYKVYSIPIPKIRKWKEINVVLDDSLFMLSEVIALCYDNIDIQTWASKNGKRNKKLLTFATRDISNVNNFVKLLKEEYGRPDRAKAGMFKWKNVKEKNLNTKKIDLTLSYFRCSYCPDSSNISVIMEIMDEKNNNILDIEANKKPTVKYYQTILDRTFAQGVDYAQLEERSSLMYLKKSKEPYTGKCFGYYEDGQKGLKGNYKKGKKDGKWEYWYSNGQKKLEGIYVNGLKNGKFTYWYTNGNLRIESNYDMDKMVGMNTWWFENGQKKKEATYKDGVYMGKIEWDEKGNVIEDTFNKLK
jgi:antitoxin component YwqK of YwqJK toxin-antitoxin module